ncbi:SpoIIE family protein phosphatase [Streptomyces minutiscleroticus]|nr:SpoIIE family protein phosphatase [Streptomyces minutiscleroticus]
MADRGASILSFPDDWPDHPDPILALHRMGSFDWDLEAGSLQLDAQARELFELSGRDDRPEALRGKVPADDAHRLDAVVDRALRDGSESYGAYFRVRLRDGSLRWTHTQGSVRRDADGRPYRIIGIVRDATEELRAGAERSEWRAAAEARRRRTDVVQAATAALAHAHTVQDVIDVLEENRGIGHLGATSVVMGLVEGARIRLVAEGPEGSFVPGTRVTRIDDPYPMSEAVRTLAPRFIESPEEFAASYPLLWPHLTDLRITSAAYLPLVAQGRPVGALGLLYHDKSGFSAEDRNVLVALASSIAQSLMRAMLYEEEKDLAAGLQQAMLPRTIPDVPGADIAVRYRSGSLGRDIGGDWYDVIPLPGGRVGAVIGDVQGHDTHAAAVMGQLRIVLRAYAVEGHDPVTVMARASVFLHELDTDRFATCLYAEADPATGLVRLVRAGHVDPLVRDGGGTCRRTPVVGGLPLGLSAEFGRTDYPVSTFELGPGQTLLLFTDGLVERPGTDLADGVRDLGEQVSSGPDDVQDLADELIGAAARRGGGDDMALLLLRRRGPAAQQAGGRLRLHVGAGDPEALSEARHMIRAAVRAWDAADRADEVELVADELVTNALLHTEGAAVVTLRVLAGPGARRRLRVEVEDSSSAQPRRREAGESAVSGRGLLLVDLLTERRGVEACGGGKRVWCEFGLPAGVTAAPA